MPALHNFLVIVSPMPFICIIRRPFVSSSHVFLVTACAHTSQLVDAGTIMRSSVKLNKVMDSVCTAHLVELDGLDCRGEELLRYAVFNHRVRDTGT